MSGVMLIVYFGKLAPTAILPFSDPLEHGGTSTSPGAGETLRTIFEHCVVADEDEVHRERGMRLRGEEEWEVGLGM